MAQRLESTASEGAMGVLTCDGTGPACFAATASAVLGMVNSRTFADASPVMTNLAELRQIFLVGYADPFKKARARAFWRAPVLRWA